MVQIQHALCCSFFDLVVIRGWLCSWIVANSCQQDLQITQERCNIRMTSKKDRLNIGLYCQPRLHDIIVSVVTENIMAPQSALKQKSIYLSICRSVNLSICPSVHLSICRSVDLSICHSVDLSICRSVDLLICQSVYLSICLSVCLSVMALIKGKQQRLNTYFMKVVSHFLDWQLFWLLFKTLGDFPPNFWSPSLLLWWE